MPDTAHLGSLDSLHQIIAHQAMDVPRKTAISAPERRPLHYGELRELIETQLAVLNSVGIGRGDRVAIVLPNGPEMATAFLVVAAGAIAAPLNPAYQAAEFEFYLIDLKAKGMLILSGMDSPARQVAARLGILTIDLVPCPEQAAGVFTLSNMPANSESAIYAHPDDLALVLHTSGTTSRPKIVPLSQRNVCTSARNIVATLTLSKDDRCLNIMPLFHIHGLMAAVLATITAGAEVICAPGFNRTHFFNWLERHRPTWYTAVPTLHMAILEAASEYQEIIRSVPLRFLRSSSASLPPQVMAQLETVFNAPVIEAYGMTEAAHQMASNPLPPGKRKPGSVGCAAGPDVAIMDSVGLLLASGETGEIVIRGDNVTTGYENNPTANSGAFSDGWFRTGDQGWMNEDGYIHITGRLKEIINRGGEKVSPREVDEVLLNHPDVLQAVAFAVRHQSLGEDLAAVVVLNANATITASELRQGLFGQLAEFKIPNQILIVDDIPKGATGKVQRIGLAEKLAPHFQTAPTAPRNATETTLIEIFEDILGTKLNGVHANLFSAGCDSLSRARAIGQVCARLHCDLPITILFHYPTVAELAHEIIRNPRQKKITIPKRTTALPYICPLSFAQQRLWFMEQLEPDISLNNVARVLHLRGYLDQTALQESLKNIINRHDTLRTSIVVREGEAMQFVASRVPFSLAKVDLRDLTPERQESQIALIAEREATHSFELATPPLIRAVLLQQGEHEHVLVITLHHIVSDGWSMGILSRELTAFYRAALINAPADLPELPIQYSDYIHWQRDWMQADALTPLTDYWKKKLANSTRLEVPSDRAQTQESDYKMAQCSLQLSSELSTRTRELGQSELCTPFMTLLACLNLLLHRYTGESDIVVGAPTSGRQGRDEVKDLIGFFVNTIPLRTDMSGNPSFRQLLKRVRTTAWKAYKHSALPFDKLVETVRPDRSSHRNPLFSVEINSLKSSWYEFALDGLVVEECVRAKPLTGSALSLEIFQTKDHLKLDLGYQTALFDEWRIKNMLLHLQTLLEAIVAEPQTPIGELPLLTPAERHQILVQWNDTAADYPRDSCIHQLFEEQAARTPDAVALVFEDQQLSYGELNARANQLAHHLITLGVGPDVLVGICLERSLELIVGLLGILKAGGAYVPLDPSYPKERLAFMLADTAAPVLLTQQGLLEQLPPFAGNLVCLDLDWNIVATQPDSQPPSHATAENLAYVIYTSGSTGRPKGVAIGHRALVNHMTWMQGRFPLAAKDRVLQKTSISGDASAWELFAAFFGGAQLYLAAPGIERSPQEVIETVRRQQITVLQVVPTMLAAMLDEEGLSRCTTLRYFYCGGEVLLPEVARRFRAQLSAELINLYGPTEATIDATYAVYLPESNQQTISIGRPISNAQIYIFDAAGAPVPVGVTGELYVGGAGLARGYLNRPELTAERFLPDPYSAVPGARMYRTGDQARYLADGNIEYLGRIDEQVKIRGFRIELGEIEAVLAEHASVRQAVVIAREDAPGDKRLVAYVVPTDDSSVDIELLRGVLRERLPDYMRPSAYVVLERLPLTPNGKIDRKALPTPSRDTQATGSILPRNPLEEKVAEVWCELLHLDQVGVHDNFFELGGHSLLAARVVARLSNLLKIELPLRTFFETPTVAALAAEVGKKLGAGEARAITPIVPQPRGGDLPLSFAQQRLWFLDRLLPDKTVYNIPSAWRLQGRFDASMLQRSLDELVARHETLRTRFAVIEGEPVQVITPPYPGALLRTDLSAMPLAEREARSRQIFDTEAHRPFDLETGPVLRAQLLCMTDDEHLLLLNLHHIASDGWSMGVFCRELAVAYGAFTAGREPELPTLPIQYADYAVWQREQLQGEVFERQLAYWRAQLADLSILELPTDRPRSPMQSYRGARVAFDLPAPLIQGLKMLGRQEGATLYMTLLAAFQALLARYSGQEDIAVGAPIAGRTRNELEGLIGFFVNTLVLRTDLSGNPKFCDLLTRVRESALQAYEHQDVPFERLVEELKPERDGSRSPLFQVMFALQNTSEATLALQGVEVSPLALPGHSAKFDLTLTLTEGVAGLHGEFEYASDLFDASTIERMAGHFTTLLEGIVAEPQTPIGELPLLTPAERHQILVQWNDTAADYPRDSCIHQLFEEQAARTPDAVALVFEDQQLSYGELNARANQLAHHLITLGVGPDVLVGICLERSLELIVGLLGILKAGGAYVPLDPSYPKERLAFMLADTAAPVLLTQQGLLEQLPPFAGNLVCLDLDWNIVATQPDSQPPSHATAENLAYVIYTSGSTGRPKGVLVPHRGVVRLVFGTDYVRFDDQQRFLLLSSISFDAVTFELWGALLHGAMCLVVADRLPDLDTLGQTLREHRVTTAWLTASFFNLIVDEAPATLLGLRHLITGGEALSIDHVRRALDRMPELELVNGYGPTENTTFSCCHPIRRPLLNGLKSISIGRPIANTRAYVLDQHDEPCPIGVAGELHLAGDGMARGYLNYPEQTADKFPPDPFSTVRGARMYRTGDLARFLADGNIEFLGRNDSQVKLRGFRIELGEIESVLTTFEMVRQAAVVAREDKPGDKYLTAYVVTKGTMPTTAELRARLKRQLPDYMIPAAFIQMPKLPLTPNGKVDLKALPAPPKIREGSSKMHVPPRDDVEANLCRIWAELLGRTQIGIDDNFFEAGGHSLLAARMFARLDRIQGRSLPLATLFQAPTVRELACLYRNDTQPAVAAALVAINSTGSLPPIFGVPGVGGNVLGFANLARNLGPQQPFFGLQSIGLDGSREPLETIEEMATQYLTEVRHIKPYGPYYFLGVCFGATVAFEMARQVREAGEEVAFLGLLDPANLQGDLLAPPIRSRPIWLKRATDFWSFFASRLSLYRTQMRHMGFWNRLQFVRDKFVLFGEVVEKRDVFRGDRREFYQRRVYDTNLLALLRYKSKPMGGSAICTEIFSTSREDRKTTDKVQIDWTVIAGPSAPHHKMPGKDSGDMLQGENSKVLAASLADRLQLARQM
jgi:amino acid adenylation domain-containing protein